MSEVISSFKSLIAVAQVLAIRMLFICVILHTMWSGQELAVAMHLALWYIVLVCHQYEVCKKNMCMLMGMVV